ncbi:putative transcription elongation factor SPT5 homolog 1 [Cornus florida]|uniref:putative transcription elongation factor SPT5 homolog 1 n=1 Tax=Cornus florida TaxID=4283 RepID=UPI00289C6E97|nr:putative transcription elongation factor SPT5 homolog 1 [Cornus florida]
MERHNCKLCSRSFSNGRALGGHEEINSNRVVLVPIKEMTDVLLPNKQPVFDGLEKFRQLGESGDGDMGSRSTLFANRKKNHFTKGDLVIDVKDARKHQAAKKIKGDTVHIRQTERGYLKSFAVRDKEFFKCFNHGKHVKLASGATESSEKSFAVRDKEVFKCFNHGKHVKLASGATESSECGDSLASTSTRTPRRVSKIWQPGESGDGDMGSRSTLFANRKKDHFTEGDPKNSYASYLATYNADFIVDDGTELRDEGDSRRTQHYSLLPNEHEDIEALNAMSSHTECDEEAMDVQKQDLLPSVRDPKLWLMKCTTGHER